MLKLSGYLVYLSWKLSCTLQSLSVLADFGYAYGAGRFRFRLRFQESAPVGAMKCPLLNSAGAYSCGRLRWVDAGSRSQMACRNDFLIPVSDSDGHRHAVTMLSFMYLLFKLMYFL